MNQSTYTLGHRILALLCALALAVGLMPTAALAEAAVAAGSEVTVTVTEADANTAISGADVKFVCGVNGSDATTIATGADGKAVFQPTTEVTLKTVEVSKGDYASKTVEYTGSDLTVVLVKPVTSITDSNDPVYLIKNGAEGESAKTLNPTVEPEGQTEGITWTSGNAQIAAVDDTGKVTAVGKGTTTITAAAKEHPDVKKEYSVTVQVVPEGVTLDETTLNLQPGKEATLHATIDPSDADTQNAITWESNATEVATVDQTGKVTAVANGTTTITATTENGKTATCTVKVTTAATGITIGDKPAGNTITYGESYTFNATLTPNTATDTVVWSIESGSDCVELDESTPGKVTATKVGTATIKASAGTVDGSVYDTYQFSVEPKVIKVNGLTLDNKVYDGKATVSPDLLRTVTFDKDTGSDSVNLSGVTFSDTSAATASETPYPITANYTNASVDNDNYTLDKENSVTSASLTITKKSLEVSALTDANGNAPTYTAGTSYDGLKLTLTGIVEADSTLSGTFTGVQATSTTKINVMEGGAEVSLVYPAGSTSAYDTNYTLPLEAKLVLTKKPLTVTVTGAEKEFDGTTVPKDTNGNAVQFVAALDGIIGEDKVTPVVTNSAYLDVNASDSVNVKADVALDGDDAQNYILQPEITFVPGKITKSNNINLTVEFEPSVQDPENTMDVIVRAVGGYDGTLLSGTAVVTYDTATETNKSASVPITNGAGSYTIDALPGEQTVSVSFTAADSTPEPTRNYTGTKVAAAKYNENYKVQELSGAAITEVTYGTPAFLGVYAVEKGTNTQTNAAIQYTSNNTAAATIDENTGKITVVNVDAAPDHKVTFTAKAQRIADQYNASYSKTYEVTLVKQSVTPSITCSGKTYDGTAVAAVTGSLEGVVGGDSVILSNNGTDGNLTAVYDSAAAGGHTVTANGLTLLGTTAGGVAAANNYTLTATTATCTATILPRSIEDADFTIALDGEGTMYYTGGNREPVPTVKVDLNGDGTKETTLVSGTDYTVSYEQQKELGENTAKVTVTAQGNYSSVRNQNYSISYKPVDPNAEMIKVNGNHAGAADTQRAYPKDSNNKIWWYNSNVMLTPADDYTLDDVKPTENVALQDSKTYSDEGLNIFSGKKVYIKETATGFISELEIGDAINIDKTAPRLTAVSTTEGIRYGDADYYNQAFTTTFVVDEANYGANTGNSSFAVSAGTDVAVYGDQAARAAVTCETSDPTAITVTVDPGETVIAGEYHKPYVTITDPAGNKLVAADGVAVFCSDGKAVDNILKTLDTKAPEVVLSYAFADDTPLEATHYYGNTAYYKNSFAATYAYSDENGIDLTKVFKTVAASEGSGFGAVGTNPIDVSDKIEIPASVDNNGHYQFGAYGVDKAGNALTVKEMNTSGQAEQAVYTGKNAADKFVSIYHKVLDTVNPVATITVNAGNSLRKELQTNYNNRYYFNDSFTTTISVAETNYDAAKVTARVGSVNSSTVEQNGKTLQTQEVSATSVLTTHETASPYMYSQQVTADGVYCFDLKGVDRAGNQIVLNGGDRAANFVQTVVNDTIGDELTERYVTYAFAEDKTAPVLNVTMKDANNKNNGFNQQTGNFYEATLTSVGYQLSTNYPYRSSKVADFAFTTKDNSPVTVLYKVDSTAANSNFAYERNGAAGMIGQAGAAGAEAYADGLAYTQQTADKEQILQINSLLIEDLAGNQVSYSKTENENKIYLDVSAPTDDQLQPVVRLSYPSPVTQNTMSHRDISGVNLYKDTVVVTADVMDPYTNASQEARGSGLYRVYYKVTVNGESQTGKVGIQTGSGKSAVSADDGVYYIDYNTTGQSGPVNGGNETLTASDKLTFTFNPNDGVFNYNSIVLTVWAVDNANNEIADANKAIYKFGIDVTAPIIEISYDNNDAENEKYFKADRTATVVVTERNFDESKIDIVTESNSISGWSYSAGAAANGDEDKWTCTISYNVDGVYTLNISGTDQLGINAASVTYDGVAPQSFVIDKTAPVVDVAFDNNDVRNGKYYNQSRTATVSVTDVNFNGVNAIDVSAAVGGTAPAVSFNGLTATLPFTTDGTYSFRGTVTDMAGNVSQEFTVDEFVIDQTAPELSIEGVEDLVAYPGEVLPRIVFSDQNYEGNTIQLLRTVLDQKNVDVSELIVPNGGVTAGADGLGTGSISYEDLEHVQENDGIYTLTASVTDLAGNSTEDEVTYSVNRFGSVYVYSDALTNMIGAYKQKADEGLYISAYNVSPLIEDSTKLQISCDGASLSNQNSKAVVTGGAQAGNSGWYEYRFDISGSDLTGDGRYEITLSDKDEAGNTKTNAENPIWFYIDATKPSLDSVVGLENSIVNADSQTVSFMASDAIALSSIQVYIDDEQIQQATDFETTAYESEFQVGTGLRHRIRFVITDKAGNVLDTDEDSFAPSYTFNKVMTVSTNFFVRWFANTPLFVGSIAVGACGIGTIAFVFIRKRRRMTVSEDD